MNKSDQNIGISIGGVRTRNPVFLAPMSGVTDEAFRSIANEAGAGLVVSEMVASEELVRERKDMVRRARGRPSLKPFVIQLAGRESKWMAEGARVAQDIGAEIIDINMGCPARQVTGGLSGSALMRNLDHAVSLVEATVNASRVPVTLKMRLGWDEHSINAPELARRAQDAGVQMITVHGRTRCQFYTGKADWKAIRAVKDAITIPLVANGDAVTVQHAVEMKENAGADAVMIGRAAYGRPWWPGVIAEALNQGTGRVKPSLLEEMQLVLEHQRRTVELYGDTLGNRTFRKHLGWTLSRLHERGLISVEELTSQRAALLSSNDNASVRDGIIRVYSFADAAGDRAA